MRVFPEDAERIPGSCGPFAEEDLGRLERLELRPLGDDRLRQRPDMVEFERDGTPDRLHRDVHVRRREDALDDRRVPLAVRPVPFGQDEEALCGRRGVAMDDALPESVENRAVGCFWADVVHRSAPRKRLELLEEFVVLPKILDGVEERGMGSAAPLDEFPQTPVRDRAPNVADRAEAYVQVMLREEHLARGDFLARVRDANRAEAADLADLANVPGPCLKDT